MIDPPHNGHDGHTAPAPRHTAYEPDNSAINVIADPASAINIKPLRILVSSPLELTYNEATNACAINSNTLSANIR